MILSKIKFVLITACYLVIALFSEIRCIHIESNLQDIESIRAKSYYLNDKNKCSSTSWVSYVSFPVKSVVNGTYGIVDFSVKHPTQAAIDSLLIASQLNPVAAEVALQFGCGLFGCGGGVAIK